MRHHPYFSSFRDELGRTVTSEPGFLLITDDRGVGEPIFLQNVGNGKKIKSIWDKLNYTGESKHSFQWIIRFFRKFRKLRFGL